MQRHHGLRYEPAVVCEAAPPAIPEQRRIQTSSAAMLIAGAGLICFSGCGDPAVAFTEIKRIDEQVTEAELKTFYAIIDSLPNKKVPALPSPFQPPPVWSSSRTDKVYSLLQEEKKTLEEGWNPARLSKYLQRNRALQSALRHAEMTPDQFVSFVLTIGTALARDAAREDLDLDKILKRGELILQRLGKDQRIFSTLRDEGAYYVLQQVAWLPLVDRAQRLKQIPLENIALVRRHKERLRQIFPEDMQRDPLASLASVLNESSLPFEELAAVGTDERIIINRNLAIGGEELPATGSTPLAPQEAALPARDEAGSIEEPAETAAAPEETLSK